MYLQPKQPWWPAHFVEILTTQGTINAILNRDKGQDSQQHITAGENTSAENMQLENLNIIKPY